MTHLNEVFTSIRVIKSFGSESNELEKLDKSLLDERKAGFKAAIINDIQN